jgi:hypothetical protein
MATQNTASQPFTRRMKTGSPWTEAQRVLTTFTWPGSPAPRKPPPLANGWPWVQVSSTTSTGGWSASSSRLPITRSVLLPRWVVSPARQFGTALVSCCGSAGAPSSVSSLNRKPANPTTPLRWGRTAERAYRRSVASYYPGARGLVVCASVGAARRAAVAASAATRRTTSRARRLSLRCIHLGRRTPLRKGVLCVVPRQPLRPPACRADCCRPARSRRRSCSQSATRQDRRAGSTSSALAEAESA